MRITRDQQMILQALITSMRSTCGRKAVGAIIAKDGRIISSGYAGPPSSFPHCDPTCKQVSTALGGCNRTIHAEQNAVAYAARHGISTDGATLYCTDSPCETCAKILINTGIIRVAYLRPYRDLTGINLLQRANIPCETVNVPSAAFQSLHQLYASGGLDLLPIAE